jgi:hypothetical protein
MTGPSGLARTALLCAFITVFVSGCIERRLVINTDPQGATVILNDEEVGTSPVTVPFNWYGDYKVRVIKPGFDILDTHRDLKAPLHDKMPFDFFYGVLWPGQIIDEYEWTFRLTPYQSPDRQELIDTARQMETRALDELKAPLPEQTK